ncbi:gamma-glutamyltransferase family protein [Babesia caballi]|uniref:Gamma-glutamyltransferase family protein n=1 Tax=Babesia caballi TaxID=5871 RepID=A0AAV4LM91_BABCB|nr:gamma-glutamyltransferase family protein [Babesia caballi]
MRRNVGRSDASACDKAVGIINSLIPNELRKSFGQLDNETSTGISIQSLNNLINIHTKPNIRYFNTSKKLRNFLGKFWDSITPTTTPILPRHPQDPVDGLLPVGRAGEQWSTKGHREMDEANIRTL